MQTCSGLYKQKDLYFSDFLNSNLPDKIVVHQVNWCLRHHEDSAHIRSMDFATKCFSNMAFYYVLLTFSNSLKNLKCILMINLAFPPTIEFG